MYHTGDSQWGAFNCSSDQWSTANRVLLPSGIAYPKTCSSWTEVKSEHLFPTEETTTSKMVWLTHWIGWNPYLQACKYILLLCLPHPSFPFFFPLSPAIVNKLTGAERGAIGRAGLLVLILAVKTARGQLKQTALFIGQLHSSAQTLCLSPPLWRTPGPDQSEPDRRLLPPLF